MLLEGTKAPRGWSPRHSSERQSRGFLVPSEVQRWPLCAGHPPGLHLQLRVLLSFRMSANHLHRAGLQIPRCNIPSSGSSIWSPRLTPGRHHLSPLAHHRVLPTSPPHCQGAHSPPPTPLRWPVSPQVSLPLLWFHTPQSIFHTASGVFLKHDLSTSLPSSKLDMPPQGVSYDPVTRTFELDLHSPPYLAANDLSFHSL